MVISIPLQILRMSRIKNAQYHQAIYYLKEAESLLEETNELYLRARIYNKLGIAYKKLDLVGPSLNYLNKTIDLTEKEPGDNFKIKKNNC